VPTLEGQLGAVVERLEIKPRDLYQPLRVAITGATVSPGIFDSLVALGREQATERTASAMRRLIGA
jgi:glutamyl-tRNA synthetase